MIPDTSSANRRGFFGWRILILAIFTAALTGPGQTVGVSVFVDHFIEDLGLSRSQVSTAYLIGTLTASLALPAVGRAIDSRGVRVAMSVIGLGFGLALVAMAGVQGFVSLTVGFVAIRLFGQGSLTLVSTVAVTHWFDRRRGMALGFFSTGTSILMSLVPIGLSIVIETYDWRLAWATAGVIIWLTVIPVARRGMIDKPADVDQVADGTPPEDQHRGRAPTPSITRAEALRRREFWILAGGIGTVGMLATALNFHQISLLGDVGLSATEAAATFLPQTVGAAVGGLLFGYLSDRLLGRWLLTMVMLLLGTALVLAANLDTGISIIAYAVLLGSAGGSARSVNATLLPRWFGTRYIGEIQGAANLLTVASTALGPVAFSLVRDVSGDYGSAALTFLVLPAVVVAAALLLAPRRVPAAS